MVTLKNEYITAQINELGAELKSLKKDGKEYIWQGNPEIWGGSCPVLFPICGGLKDDKYILHGKEYKLGKHGFAKSMVFSVESTEENKAVFLLRENEQTLKSFSFAFEFRVIFTLTEKSVKIEYKVNNLNDKTMYFSVGAHEGYSTPEGIEDYDVIFSENETLDSFILDGNLLEKNTLPIIKDSKYLPLYDKYFLIDALVFKNLKSKSAVLRNRKTARAIKVDFPDADYFLLWHKHSAGYICLEPWSGIQDGQDSDYDITKKEGIIALNANCEYNNTHIITILD